MTDLAAIRRAVDRWLADRMSDRTRRVLVAGLVAGIVIGNLIAFTLGLWGRT